MNDKDYLNQNNINANYLNNYNEYDKNKEEENGANFNYNDCFLCGIKQRDNPQDRFYKCRECDRKAQKLSLSGSVVKKNII